MAEEQEPLTATKPDTDMEACEDTHKPTLKTGLTEKFQHVDIDSEEPMETDIDAEGDAKTGAPLESEPPQDGEPEKADGEPEGIADGEPKEKGDDEPVEIADGEPEETADGEPEEIADGDPEEIADGEPEEIADETQQSPADKKEGVDDVEPQPLEQDTDKDGKPADVHNVNDEEQTPLLTEDATSSSRDKLENESNKNTVNEKSRESERTTVRRSRSQEDDEEDEDQDEEGTGDEHQNERGAKKPKKDDDAEPRMPRLRYVKPDLSKMHTLEDFGYHFNERGELRQIQTGSAFVFEVIPGDRSFNQKHYEALGEVITEHVYGLMETECELQKAYVPIKAEERDPRTFIFVSENVLPVIYGEEPPSDKKLLVLIHGSGVVRAGQWARRLIINNNLDMGTMIPYIKEAKEAGYEVMLLNTNYNTDKGRMIQGSSSPEIHGRYVWKHFIREWPGKVAIVAHSAGGYVTVEMAKQCDGFMDKVFAVGFTDSVHSLSYYTSKDVSNWFIKHSKNWVSSSKQLNTNLGFYGGDCPRVSAGTPKHEETSYYSMNSIFKFFREMERSSESTETTHQTPEEEEEEEEDAGDAPLSQTISRTAAAEEDNESPKVQTPHNLQDLGANQDGATSSTELDRTVGNSAGHSSSHAENISEKADESEEMESEHKDEL